LKNWSDEFANIAHIKNADAIMANWGVEAESFRRESGIYEAKFDLPYGNKPRNRYDLFLPKEKPKGLVFFVHGGYWLAFDKNHWSHFAKGSLDSGYAVAIISYTLCPEATIPEILSEVTQALETVAKEVQGPIYLIGHSAGGFLVSRLMCSDVLLTPALQQRIQNCISVSGVHDLRPLIHAEINENIKIDSAQAQTQSPVLMVPRKGIRFCCWVGENERPEFLRQSQLLLDMWIGFDISISIQHDTDKHHFDVIDGLRDAEHPLCKQLFSSRM